MLALSDASPIPHPTDVVRDLSPDEVQWLALMDKLPAEDQWRMLRVAEAIADRPGFSAKLRAARLDALDLDARRAWIDAALATP